MTMPAAPHPDDEELSAALDGEGGGAALAEHLAECARCRSRSDALASAATWAATPVPPLGADVTDRLVAAAMAAAPATGARVDGGVDGAEAPVVPLRAVRRRPPLAWMAAVAAALFVLAGLGAVARLAGSSSGDAAQVKRSTSAAAGGTATAADSAAAGRTYAAEAAAQAAVSADLGDVADGPALVAGAQALTTAGPAAPSPVAGGAANDSAPAGATTKAANAAKPAVCLAAAEQATGLATPAAIAALRFAGQPAEAFVFTTGEGSTPHRVAVLSLPACALLADQRF